MSDILRQLGLDSQSVEWQRLALCPSVNSDWFFKDYESDSETARQVDNLCLSCPVMPQCAAQGAKGEFGVWGGIYWDGSGKPDRSKNKHKSEQVWTTIRTRIASD